MTAYSGSSWQKESFTQHVEFYQTQMSSFQGKPWGKKTSLTRQQLATLIQMFTIFDEKQAYESTLSTVN